MKGERGTVAQDGVVFEHPNHDLFVLIFIYLIRVIMVHFSVKSHEMNKAHVHTPPEEKTKKKTRDIALRE